MRTEGDKKQNGRVDGADDITNGFCIKCSPGGEKRRQQDNAEQKNSFTAKRKKQRNAGASQSRKPVYKSILQAERNNCKRKDTNTPDGQCNGFRVLCEDANKILRGRARNQKHKTGEDEAKAKDIPLGLAHPPRLPRTVVVADDGLGAAGRANHRPGDEHHKALHNRHSGNQQVALCRAAIFFEHGIHCNQQNTVGCEDKKRRNANRKNALDQCAGIPAKRDAHPNALAAE